MAKRGAPRHFYLNEQHELSRLEQEGGGSLPKLGPIDWNTKQLRLSRSLRRVKKAIEESADPLRESRYFLLARPEKSVQKLTDNKKKSRSGHFDELVDYAGRDSRILGRLGLDVLGVTNQGAIVHTTPERFERLVAVSPNLSESGRVEQSRWAFVADFDSVPPVPEVGFLDVVVGQGPHTIDDLIVVNAIENVAANYPDVRVFNLSFGDYTALGAYQTVQRTQRLQRTEQLDNLVFARDLIVVVAAGNSQPGFLPNPDYPESWQDPSWALGHWAVGFNTLKCGSFVREWTMIGGLADVPGAPSPFCRVGPGLGGAPTPDFSSHGGNCDSNYHSAASMRVLGLGLDGKWHGKIGTSHAAPVVSREAAFLLQSLEIVCPPDTRPFASTAKALLALTAQRPELPSRFRELADRTLGYGEPSRTLLRAQESSAVLVWQGVLSHKGDTARVVVPIPRAWIAEAGDPVCEIVVAWDTPVNSAVSNIYGCRRVDLALRPAPDADAIRGSRGSRSHKNYPLRFRSYGLASALKKGKVTDDLWTVEISYEETCDYPPAQIFMPDQRVSFAMRLVDRKGVVSPQAAVQLLDGVSTMTRLSAVPLQTQVPVTVKQRT